MSKPRHVLIVDDVSDMRSLLKTTLYKFDVHDIHEASSGQKALDTYYEHGHDMVFLDINLPDISGLEVLQKLLERNSRVHVVMVSGEASADNVKGALGRGAKGFVVKPYSPNKIKSALDRFGA
ncbi:MAG: response regulator [Pseudomonadales bacterium]|nr:response regulator [Pseudomonadales bacterium]